MKKYFLQCLFFLILSLLYSFKTGEEIELDGYLNGRTHPNFLKYTKNIKSVLAPGTTGTILEIKQFSGGSAGLKIKINKGKKKGETYWVFYNAKNPSLKLIDNKSKLTITPNKVNIPDAKAVIIKATEARRDPAEQALIDTAIDAARILNAKNLVRTVTPQITIDCDKKSGEKMTEPPPRGESISEGSTSTTLSPQKALALLNSEELKFVGRDLMPGSGQNRSCVFQNSKVYVVYNNCMSSKSEAPVTDFQIIQKTGGEISFYNENSQSAPNSTLKREQYDSTWRISYVPTTPPKDSSLKAIKQYFSDNENSSSYCYIGDSFKAKQESKVACSQNMNTFKDQWSKETESFWNSPPSNWYSTQTKLVSLIKKAPF